jgi:predicted O-methyltransferase YrrM
MVGKAIRRMRGDSNERMEAVAWARGRATPIASFCEAIDPRLWDEAQTFGRSLRAHAADLGAQLGVALGGGARVELLYFVTRLRRPKRIVETGVLHGYSSSAFLCALDVNGDGGRLYSSDFPYFRERDPEKLVGVLVPDELRSQWCLRLEGDRRNLPGLLAAAGTVDLFHYDSDKTHRGRRFALQVVEGHLAHDAAVLMDDIQDNLFFRDWTRERHVEPMVLGMGSYFVGAFGLPRGTQTTRSGGRD